MLVVLSAALLLAGGALVYRWHTPRLMNQWQDELAAQPDKQLLDQLRPLAEQGDRGLMLLARALCSSRQVLAEAAGEVLDEELHRWAALPSTETLERRVLLAETLADEIDHADDDARARGAVIAERLLRWPAEAGVPTTRITLACERILEHRPEDGRISKARDQDE